MSIGWLIALFGIRRQEKKPTSEWHACRACGQVGPTTCLPFLGSKRFCLTCARYIMGRK